MRDLSTSYLLIDPKNVTTFKHTCIVCGKAYKHKHHLKRHHDFECGVDPKFKCAFCPHRTRYKDSLTKHMLARHQQAFLEQHSVYSGHQQVFEAPADIEVQHTVRPTGRYPPYRQRRASRCTRDAFAR